MAIAAEMPARPSKHLRGRRYDRVFFAGLVSLLEATVFLGFAHTYYLAGVFEAPLASRILQVHGAVFSAWMILLFIQSALISVDLANVHRRLGIAGFFLAGLVVVLGIVAAANSLARQGSHISSALLSFSITPFTDMLLFTVLAGMAFRLRSHPPAHKRLILMATIALARAAISRWPIAFVFHNQVRAILISYVFVVLLLAYDIWSMRKVHRATLWATVLLLSVHLIRIPIGQSENWHTFARWVQSWGI